MKDSLAIKTPVLADVTPNGAKLIGTAEGWIDPHEVCGVISGIMAVPKIRDMREERNPKLKPGALLSLLYLKGGEKLLVMGTPQQMKDKIDVYLKGGPVETLAEKSETSE